MTYLHSWRATAAIALLIIGAIAHAQTTSPADVRAQVEALLGAQDDAAGPAQWRSLGDAAIPILESVVFDSNALSTRRARSLDGLAALGAGDTTMQRIAWSSGEPTVVRMAAARGLGQVLPEAAAMAALAPLLQDAQPRLRGAVAEALSHRAAGCEAVRSMMSKESEGWRARFASRCVPSSSSAAAPIPGGSSTDADPLARVVVYRVTDPSGTTLYNYGSATNSIKINPTLIEGSFSVALPNSPTVPFAKGDWTFNLLASKPTTIDVQALVKTPSTPGITSGRLNANLFFVGVPGLDARSAPTNPAFQAMLSKARSIYAQVGIEIADVSYIDVTGTDADRFSDLMEPDLGALMRLSRSPRARDGAINLFFVHSLTIPGLGAGFIALGESAGLPGNPLLGSTGSGVAVTMADFPNGVDEQAFTLAHEAGHWLGLFHPTEAWGGSFDPLPDTPECPGTFPRLSQFCIGRGADNLMFWLYSGGNTRLTFDQQFVMLRNPVVSQRTAGVGSDARTVRLGTVAVPSTQLSAPITVNVPEGAVSVDLAGAVPTPVSSAPAWRVPEDFATIQLAINNARAGDSIRVSAGRWCGARITKTVNLIGEGGATVVGCPAGNPGPVGNPRRRGFRIEAAASGSSISRFAFDGAGYADTNRLPLYRGIETAVGANDLLIDGNTFLGTAYAIYMRGGNNNRITHNTFDGFAILSSGDGGAGVLDFAGAGGGSGNVIQYNRFTSAVPVGNFSFASWVDDADVSVAGVVVSGLTATVVSNNQFAIAANANGNTGAGIIATDNVSGFATKDLTLINNDGRDSGYGLIVTRDLTGGAANTAGATIRGNFGVNIINGNSSSVRNRSKLILCDPDTGVCGGN